MILNILLIFQKKTEKFFGKNLEVSQKILNLCDMKNEPRISASNRKYAIVCSGENMYGFLNYNLTLLELLADDETEFCLALQERIDDVLDLRVDDFFIFKPTRDSAKSVGIIKRVD